MASKELDVTTDEAKARSDKIVGELHDKDPDGVNSMYDSWSGSYELPQQQQKQPLATESIANAFFAHSGAKTSEMYSGFAGEYEHDLLNMSHGYTHPQKIARVADAHLKDKNARILDVCAGTGLGGVALKELGFTNIDAIDGSRGMLDLAAKKKIYKNLFEELIGSDSVKSVEQASYDAIVTSGSFLPGHLGPMHLKPLALTLKSGGLFCMAMREEYLRTDYLLDLEPTMDRMEAEGIWQKVQRGIMEHYYNDLPGVFYVYRRV
uniref:MTS domain-containing protein n=1 Tax=Macrostomum lignano TaxID=282301 RepID=A0A1I8IKG7_9PLAT